MSTNDCLAEKESFYAQVDSLEAQTDSEEEDAFRRDQDLRQTARDFFKQTAGTLKSPLRPVHVRTAPYCNTTESTPGAVLKKRSREADNNRLQNTHRQDFPSQLPSASTKVQQPPSWESISPTEDPTGPREVDILSGMSLYYIPGNKSNKLRSGRMRRAQQHGAALTRDITSATHIVVDKGLTYRDIERDLASVIASVISQGHPKIINENYPLDCIQKQGVFSTGWPMYRVKGVPTTGPLKTIDNNTNKSIDTKTSPRPLSQEDLEPKTLVKELVSPQDSDETLKTGTKPPALILPSSHFPLGERKSCPKPTDSHQAGHDYADELSQLIDDVQKKYKTLPALADEDDSLASDEMISKDDAQDSPQSSPEGGRLAKRRKTSETLRSRSSWEDKFACSRGGREDQKGTGGPNAKVIAVLQQMLEYYTRTNDRWRVQAYRKGINTLARQTVRVRTAAEAVQLPFIVDKLAQKIEEIDCTDRLQRLEYAQKDPISPILKLFLGIYGVGITTADKWIAQGHRTLDDLRDHAKLTTNQRLGIDHYDDLNTRIPRAEVAALAAYVDTVAAGIDKDVELLVGGSYRRGADSSGDLDLLITKKGTRSTDELSGFLTKLVSILTSRGFLTAELASHDSHGTKYDRHRNSSKWHGCCCLLPRTQGPLKDRDKSNHRPVWRRIDFLLVPEIEYGAALIYFTGNDVFNRSIRLLASRKKMRLNHRGLYKDVVRGTDRQKLTEGELVEGKSERRIFDILGVEWREPHERWC